ncbi:MAG: PqiC family protein [Cognaticolwellia sp.]
MKPALIIIIFSLILLTACSANNTPTTQYYLLNSPTTLTPITQQNVEKNSAFTPEKQAISINLLPLPDYLQQANLVLQLANHQLHYSHTHMWAEPLNKAIAKALANDLNHSNNSALFSVNSAFNTPETADIVLKITSFQATHQSQVLLIGSYRLQTNNLEQGSKTQHFNFAVTLTEDGYPHAVEQMRAAITLLAQQLSASINR